jgi:hypothetical protein
MPSSLFHDRHSVRLQAPITVRDLSSEVRRDWIQLISRKPAHTTAVKTGLGETPPERGIPRKLELRQRHHQLQYNTISRSLQELSFP